MRDWQYECGSSSYPEAGHNMRRRRPSLLCRYKTCIGKFGSGRGNVLGKLLLAVGIDSKTEVVAAKNEIAGCKLVHCMVKFCNLGKGFIAGRDHHATSALEGFHSIVSAHWAETMGDDVFNIQIFEPVKHAGIGAVRVFFKVEYGTVVVLPSGVRTI